MRGALAAISSLMLVATTAGAAQAGPARSESANDIRFNLWVASVVGFVGITYAHTWPGGFQVELGGGWGITGVQLSLMPKVTVGDAHRFVVGLGPSLGIDPDHSGAGSRSYWLNADLGYEYRGLEGFSFLAAGGFVKGVGGCIFEECLPPHDEETWSGQAVDYASVQLRLAFGYWF